MGASASQTGLSQAEPEVSALRASIPSAIAMVDVLPIDLAAEVLRALSFVGEGFGAYSNFDVAPVYRPFPARELGLPMRTALLGWYANTPEEVDNIRAWAIPNVLRMAWHWDGDGTLVFATRDFMLINSDCKKDYGWERHTEGDWITEVIKSPDYFQVKEMAGA